MRLLLLLASFVLAAAFSVGAHADAYYNSAETGCDGGTASVTFCDDFEDGSWYTTNCDSPDQSGNDGWCGTIFVPISPAGAAVCGAGVTPFGNCVGTAGTHSGGGGMMAMRGLKVGACGTTGQQKCPTPTLYVRWYAKWLSGYSFGAEKHTNFTTIEGDIAFANVQLNCGAGGTSSTASVYIQIIHGEDVCIDAGVTLSSGRWYFFEMRVTAHPTDGTIQLWINDCGTDGTTCGASPTLRYSNSTLNLPGNANGSQISGIWFENWSNPGSTGTGQYLDQIKAATVGPIGFAAAGEGDVTSPVISSPNAGTPTSTGTTDATVSTDEGNGTLYWAVVTNAGSATDAQIKAGSGGNIVAAGSQAVIGTGTQTVASITGLAIGTLHQIKFLHADAAANDSAQASVNLTTVGCASTSTCLPIRIAVNDDFFSMAANDEQFVVPINNLK